MKKMIDINSEPKNCRPVPQTGNNARRLIFFARLPFLKVA
jgi:hypothetical protein